MGDIPAWGWFALAAVPFVSMGVALVLAFVNPTAAGVVSAGGVLFLTPLVAVTLWLWAGGESKGNGTDKVDGDGDDGEPAE